jgi:hypothetical protein
MLPYRLASTLRRLLNAGLGNEFEFGWLEVRVEPSVHDVGAIKA